MKKKVITASIITIGTEIIKGKIIDSNSGWISNFLNYFGIKTKYHVSVSDSIEDILNGFKATKDSNIVIATGGLGPTEDDNTKKALGIYLNKELYFNKTLWENICSRYKKITNKSILESNKKQAMSFEGAVAIKNNNGSAPGLYYKDDEKYYFLLPGPPNENRPMIKSFLSKIIKDNSLAHIREYEKVIRAYGIGESSMAGLLKNIKTECELGFYFKQKAWLELHISKREKSIEKAKEIVKKTASKIENILMENEIFFTGDIDLNRKVFNLLKKINKDISFAETVCGGKMCSKIVEIPGASNICKGGLIAYEDGIKIQNLNIKKEVLKKHGAVSKQVAEVMAKNIRNLMSSDIGVAVTGVAGPSGDTANKPVGLVYFSIADDKKCYNFKNNFFGNRKRIINKIINSVFTEIVKIYS